MSSDRRQQIIDAALDAFTVEECLKAEADLREWLRENPDDVGMYDLVSLLATVKQAAAEQGRREEPAPALPKAA
jgi:hypothetical protein